MLVGIVMGLAQSNLSKGKKLFDRNLFLEAIPYFQEEANSSNKDSKVEALSMLADCYRITGQFELAEKTYKELFKKNKKDPGTVLKYAHSLKSSAKYSEAKEEYKLYSKMNPNDKMGPIYVQSCDSAQKWLDETIGQEAKNLDKANSKDPDFSPVFYKDGFVFTSSREGSKKRLISFNGGNEVLKLDLYYEPITGGLNALPNPTNLKKLNTPNHEGPATFSAKGDTIYFTRTVSGKKDKQTNRVLNSLQVFMSIQDSTGKWSKPQSAFDFNSNSYSVGQPSLSPDGKTIFYMSDMAGGKGFTDIYYSEKTANGKWGPPINVGDGVNTFGHELFPFIAANGKLYFSSDVHPGMGKLDIFSAELIDGKWTNIQNLKPPINSISDDFGIAFDKTCKVALFSSDRFNGKGSDDIYSFIINSPLELTLNGGNLEFPDFTSFDGTAYKLVDLESQQETVLSPNNGKYSVKLPEGKKLQLSARKEGMSYNKVTMDLQRGGDENYLKFHVQSKLKPIKVNGVLINKIVQDSTHVLENKIPGAIVQLLDSTGMIANTVCDGGANYKFEKTFQPGVEYTVISGMKGNPPVSPKIVCKGTVLGNDNKPLKNAELKLTDSKNTVVEKLKTNEDGSYKLLLDSNEQYKLTVSQEGFSDIVSEINTKGMNSNTQLERKYTLKSSDRVHYEGTVLNGDKPVAGSQMILYKDQVAVDKTTTDQNGKFGFDLVPNKNYSVASVSNGFFSQQTDISTQGKSSVEALKSTLKLDSIQLDKTIEIPNIYYELNKAEIYANSLPALDVLVDFLLVNPDLIIELSAHTDARGDAAYNMKLSQERADNVKNYLILSDIVASRIITKGYGATQPKIKDAKTEEEHKVNRRTEFKVISRTKKN